MKKRTFSLRLPLDLYDRLYKESIEAHEPLCNLMVRKLNDSHKMDQSRGARENIPMREHRRIHAQNPVVHAGVHRNPTPTIESPQDLPPVGESGEVPHEVPEDVIPGVTKTVNWYVSGEKPTISQLTKEEFYALPLEAQIKAVQEGRF